MKVKPLIVWSKDWNELRRLATEYRDYCGLVCNLYPNRIVVHPRSTAARQPSRTKRLEPSNIDYAA